MKNILETDNPLNLMIEEGQFILDKNQVWCIASSCTNCKHKNTCTKEEETEEVLEHYYNKATRDNIKFGKVDKQDWITNPVTQEDLKNLESSNCGYKIKDFTNPTTQEAKNTYLSSSNQIVYKTLDNKLEEDYILYKEDEDEDEDVYYCIAQCKTCKHNLTCKPKLKTTKSEKYYVAIDASSQEPLIVTYLSLEPRYVDIFKNESLNNIPYLLDPINMVLEEVLNQDIQNPRVLKFLDKIGFENKTTLYRWATTIYKSFKDFNEEEIQKVVEEIDSALKSYSK